LHPVRPAKAAHLSRQLRLPVSKPYVLNDTVTEHDIKRAILNTINMARVTLQISNIVFGLASLQVAWQI